MKVILATFNKIKIKIKPQKGKRKVKTKWYNQFKKILPKVKIIINKYHFNNKLKKKKKKKMLQMDPVSCEL